MPFKSAKQRAYLFAKKPEVAKKFVEEGKGKVAGYSKSIGPAKKPTGGVKRSSTAQTMKASSRVAVPAKKGMALPAKVLGPQPSARAAGGRARNMPSKRGK